MAGIHEQLDKGYYCCLYCQVLTEKKYKKEWTSMVLQAQHLSILALGVLSDTP